VTGALPSECPRCGYDLSGAYASWTEACPTELVCPECGTRFECARLCRLSQDGPEWSFETRRRFTLGRFFGTLGRMLILHRSLNQVRAEHAFRPWRLAAMALAVLALVILPLTALAIAGTVPVGRGYSVSLDPGNLFTSYTGAPYWRDRYRRDVSRMRLWPVSGVMTYSVRRPVTGPTAKMPALFGGGGVDLGYIRLKGPFTPLGSLPGALVVGWLLTMTLSRGKRWARPCFRMTVYSIVFATLASGAITVFGLAQLMYYHRLFVMFNPTLEFVALSGLAIAWFECFRSQLGMDRRSAGFRVAAMCAGAVGWLSFFW